MRLAIAALALLAAAAAPALSGAASGVEGDRDRVPTAAPAGPPVTCVNLQQIRQTRVRDDRTIDFMMRGGRVYRNTLPHGCPGLGFEERFAYRTSLSRLCSVDTITVLRSGGSLSSGASCGLGKFQPVTLAKR
jgi:hypothetical protein